MVEVEYTVHVYTTIFPRFFFSITLLLFPSFHNSELYYTFIPLMFEMMLRHHSRYEKENRHTEEGRRVPVRTVAASARDKVRSISIRSREIHPLVLAMSSHATIYTVCIVSQKEGKFNSPGENNREG